MNASPEAIIEQTKHLFLSEDFSRAFLILRECMSPEDVPDKTIFDLLKGEIGYNVDGSNVDFDKKFIDSDYSQEANEILENYDFLVEIDNLLFQVTSSFKFDLSKIASTNDWITNLKSSENTLISKSNFKYFKEVSEIMMEAGYHDFYLSEYSLYHKGTFYLFKRYDHKLIQEISSIYKTALEATQKYQSSQDFYLN
jgi:hypothetical protein